MIKKHTMRIIKKHTMLSLPLVVASLLLCSLLAACGGSKKNDSKLPSNFATLSDADRVQYLMDNISPDSVAVFIYSAALGHVPGARIDTLANAALYAYEHYKGDDLNAFADAFDSYPKSLPLPEKMKVYALAGTYGADALGYQMGLEYVAQIRDNHMKLKDVDSEIAALKEACANDPETFERFMTGFRVVLELDHGKDLPEDIYTKYINEKQ